MPKTLQDLIEMKKRTRWAIATTETRIFEAWFISMGTSVLNPSNKAPRKICYCRIPPSMVSLLRDFNILMKTLSIFLHSYRPNLVRGSPGAVWPLYFHRHSTTKEAVLHVSFSLPPSKPYTTNRQACQEFLRRCHFASSSWHCSACRICVPVNISLFISASNIWQNMEPVGCTH